MKFLTKWLSRFATGRALAFSVPVKLVGHYRLRAPGRRAPPEQTTPPMYYDDRLATVLRTGVSSDRSARIQLRQLLDLLGSLPTGATGPQVASGFERLSELALRVPPDQRAAIISDRAVRLTNPRLVAVLAGNDPAIAAAAISSARLTSAEWADLIPRLPVQARGLLRHRRDLGPEPQELLQRLGIHDLVLTGPDAAVPANPSEPTPDDEPLELVTLAPDHMEIGPEAQKSQPADIQDRESPEIGALVRRIEAFRKARETATAAQTLRSNDAPRLPLEELQPEPASKGQPLAFDFATDAAGRINWSDPAIAPMVIGMALAVQQPGSAASSAPIVLAEMKRHLPVNGGTVILSGAPAISGRWRIDATPRFSTNGGHFIGYCGRMRRDIGLPVSKNATEHEPADRIRQMLHELRTPVNAVQGFAEIIQQQLYGPTPHEYRALAASIASDAARILAGFDELDRLAKLESGAMELEAGEADMATLLSAMAAQLESHLRARSSALTVWGNDAPALVPLAKSEAERLAWRILATLAGAVTAGEQLDLHIVREAERVIFAFELPVAFADTGDLFAASAQGTPQALNAGMFGAGFSLRLARAEALAAGGMLRRDGDILRLVLPLLTLEAKEPSDSNASGNARGKRTA